MDQQVQVSLVFPRSGQRVDISLPYYVVQAFSRRPKESQSGSPDLLSHIRFNKTCETSAEG